MNWLVKSDPDEYSADDLARERTTLWSGVRNALAQIHIRAMRKGDAVLVYHTGSEKAVVAQARVSSAPTADRTDSSGRGHAVELAFESRLPRSVPLAEIKAHPACRDFALVKMSRLSVMPVSDAQWNAILALANTADPCNPRGR